MCKCDLALPLQHAKKGVAIMAAIVATTIGFSISQIHGQITEVYTPLPSTTTSLGFGADSSIVSAAATPILGLSYNNSSVSGSIGNSWAATAQGSFALGAVAVTLYQSRATTSVTSGQLVFGTQKDGLAEGLSGLASLSLPMSYSATKSVTIASPPPSITRFEYNFDLYLNNGLLGITSANVLDSLNLKISSAAGTIFDGSVFAQILGLVSITDTQYLNTKVQFNYNPITDGDLTFEWSADVLLNAGLLGAIDGSGTANNLFTISDNQFGYLTPVPVPEPSSLLLCAIGLGIILRRGRRTSEGVA